MWFKQRRPEIIALYENRDLRSRAGQRAESHDARRQNRSGGARRRRVLKEVELHFGAAPRARTVHLHLYLPAARKKPVPLFLSISFSGATPSITAAAAAAAKAAGTTPAPPRRGRHGADRRYPRARLRLRLFHLHGIQPDRPNAFTSGVIGLTLRARPDEAGGGRMGRHQRVGVGHEPRAGLSRTDRDVDAKRVAIVGHSRLGKTVPLGRRPWTNASRMVFSSQGGEMGSALSRRDYGESIDDMAANLGHHFAGISEIPRTGTTLPVDAHCPRLAAMSSIDSP